MDPESLKDMKTDLISLMEERAEERGVFHIYINANRYI